MSKKVAAGRAEIVRLQMQIRGIRSTQMEIVKDVIGGEDLFRKDDILKCSPQVKRVMGKGVVQAITPIIDDDGNLTFTYLLRQINKDGTIGARFFSIKNDDLKYWKRVRE